MPAVRRGPAFSLAAICHDLPGFTRDRSTCGSNGSHCSQGETMEIQMATTAAFKPSAPKQLPLSIQKEATMEWTAPGIGEVSVGLEINSYARAELSPAINRLNLELSRPCPSGQ